MNLTSHQARNVSRFTNATTVTVAEFPRDPLFPSRHQGLAYGFVVEIDGKGYGGVLHVEDDIRPNQASIAKGITALYESLREEGVIAA